MSDDKEEFISKIGLDEDESKTFHDEFSDDLSIGRSENVVSLHEEDDPFNINSLEAESKLRMDIDVDEILFNEEDATTDSVDPSEFSDTSESNISDTNDEAADLLSEPETSPTGAQDIDQAVGATPNDESGEPFNQDDETDNQYLDFDEDSTTDRNGLLSSRKNQIVIGCFALFMSFVIGLTIWSFSSRNSAFDDLRERAESQQQLSSKTSEQPTISVETSTDDEAPALAEISESNLEQTSQIKKSVAEASPPIQIDTVPAEEPSASKFGVPPEMVPDAVTSKNIINDAKNNWDSNTPITLAQYEAVKQKTIELEERLASIMQDNTDLTGTVSRLERSTNESFESLMRQLSLIQSSMLKLEDKIQDSTATVDDVIGNRIRLGQFNVININNKGIVTAHAPNGKRISLRQGETIYIGNERLSVTQIFAAYDVVLIGDKWFIDIRREPIGSEERLLRKEIASTKIEPKTDVFTSVGDGPSQLSYSNSYEIRANVGNKVLLFNCSNQSEKIYTISESIPGHGAIRSIRANEVVTDKYVVTYDACVSTGG